jgi:transposase
LTRRWAPKQKRRHHYATVIIDAETGEGIDVLPDRTAQTLLTTRRTTART